MSNERVRTSQAQSKNTDSNAHQKSGKRFRILLIHQNFPGQFRHIALHLAKRPDVEVLGLGRDTAPGLSGFPWLKYKLHRGTHAQTHPYLRQMDGAVLHGQAVARALSQLKQKGFTPDVILAHPGWGETLYAKEVFPEARLIHFCEWYYSTSGADFNFDPEFPPTLDDHLRVTTWNGLHLLNLQNCDAAVSPTQWQKSRHPKEYQNKIQVIHEGIDTANLSPDPNATFTLPNGTTLKAGEPIVTYVARNLEPYRGFHTFMRAMPLLLKQHTTAQIIVIGGDEKSYGQAPKDAPNWREKMLREVGGALGDNVNRIHFLGRVPYDSYKKVLQISAAHVYLTYPFVLSWSMLEAMASGCMVIGADTAPIREVITEGKNGWLTDFFNPDALANKVIEALTHPKQLIAMRTDARSTALRNYAFADGLSAYLKLLSLPNRDALNE